MIPIRKTAQVLPTVITFSPADKTINTVADHNVVNTGLSSNTLYMRHFSGFVTATVAAGEVISFRYGGIDSAGVGTNETVVETYAFDSAATISVSTCCIHLITSTDAGVDNFFVNTTNAAGTSMDIKGMYFIYTPVSV